MEKQEDVFDDVKEENSHRDNSLWYCIDCERFYRWRELKGEREEQEEHDLRFVSVKHKNMILGEMENIKEKFSGLPLRVFENPYKFLAVRNDMEYDGNDVFVYEPFEREELLLKVLAVFENIELEGDDVK